MDDKLAATPHWDVFISHASEDKAEIAMPLAEGLGRYGLRVWIDKFSLRVGDSLREKIDEGLAESRYGVVILSPAFFSKNWPKKELNGLFAKEIGGVGSVLPVWHQVTQADVLAQSPMIADKLAISSAEGIDAVTLALVLVIRPEALAPQTSIADAQRAAERLTEQLKAKNANLDYRITVGSRSAVTEGGSSKITACRQDGLRIDVLAADPEAYNKNPISFQMQMTPEAWEKFQAGLRDGETVSFGPEEIKNVSPHLFEIAGFDPGTLTGVQSFSVSPSQDLLAGKLHFRLTFRQGSETEQFPYVEFEKTKVGTDLLEIRSCAPALAFQLVLGLRTFAPCRFNVALQFAGHDVRKVRQAFRALRVLRQGGLLELHDLDADRVLGTLRCNQGSPAETSHDEMLGLLIEALVDVATRLGVNVPWPSEFTEVDCANVLMLAAVVRTGSAQYPPSVLTLTIPEAEVPVIEMAIREGNAVTLTTTQAPPFSKIFGQQLDLGSHEIMFMASAFEQVTTGTDEAGNPTITARFPLIKPLVFVFEKFWPRPASSHRRAIGPGCVVFDTHAYRYYCRKILPGSALKMQVIRIYESSRQIKSLANPFVTMELASHLADDQDPDYANCRGALDALVEHCMGDGEAQLRLAADSESILVQFLLGQELPVHCKTAEVLAQLAVKVRSLSGAPLDADAKSLCAEIKRQLDGLEAQFIRDMHQVVLTLNPECTDWNPFASDPIGRERALTAARTSDALVVLASSFVVKAHLLAGAPIPRDELAAMSQAVVERFRLSLTMYLRALEHIIMTGSDMSKPERANTIWDMQVLMGVGQQFVDSPGELTLITADRAITRAAEAAGTSDHVRKIEDYLAELTCKATESNAGERRLEIESFS